MKRKKQKRQDASRPTLDAFWSWVEKTSAMYTTNEKLTQALGYCQNQRKYSRPIWKTAVFRSVIITARQISGHLQQQDVHGCLLILRKEHLQMEYYIHWWKAPERMNWMSMSI